MRTSVTEMKYDHTANSEMDSMQNSVLRDLRPMGETGRGGPTPEMLAKANAAIDEMIREFPNWAIQDVDSLDTVLARDIEEFRDGNRLKDAYKLAHDMRGQGGSFGYPVITTVAGSFCKFVNTLEDLDQAALDILRAHSKALRTILQNKIAGDGGPVGAKIQDGLDRAIARHVDGRTED